MRDVSGWVGVLQRLGSDATDFKTDEISPEGLEALCTVTPLHRQAIGFDLHDFDLLWAACRTLMQKQSRKDQRSQRKRRLDAGGSDAVPTATPAVTCKMLRHQWEVSERVDKDASYGV